MRIRTRTLLLPLAAALTLGGCERDDVARTSEPAVEAEPQEQALARMRVTEDTQQVHRPEMRLVPADEPYATAE